MKESIKGRWFLLAILFALVIGLFVFLYCAGFRITYAPDLENSWNAISAFAAWAGVVMSFVAIVVAGIVAWRQNRIAFKQAEIAEQQNKIALFEKRYEVYKEIYKIINVCEQLDYTGTHTRFSFLHEFEVIFGGDVAEEGNTTAQLASALFQVKQSEYMIKQSTFLFESINEKDVDILIDSLMDCMISIIKSKKENIDIEETEVCKFINIGKDFDAKYLDRLETEITLIERE